MPEESRARARLRTELLRARDLTGLSGRTVADRIGSTQGTVWRFEHGKALLPIPKIEAWLDACNVRGEDRRRLLELAETVNSETRPWRDLLAEDGHLQEFARLQEQDVALVQNFQATIIPGLLQTPEYARRVLTLGRTSDVAGAVAVRVERQQVLYDAAARFEFVISERALRATLGAADVLAAQLDRVVSLSRLPAVTVVVVTDDVEALPWHSFILWTGDDQGQYVTTELVHGSQEISDPESVGMYAALWESLWSAALFGDDARQVLERIAEDYRQG